jgi:hypothetical protein
MLCHCMLAAETLGVNPPEGGFHQACHMMHQYAMTQTWLSHTSMCHTGVRERYDLLQKSA